jgi:hypothetical protein
MLSREAEPMADAALIARARAITLAEAAHMLGLRLPRSGEYVGPCPACGGTDRFAIDPRKHVWNCRGARGGNDALGLVQHARGLDFLGAVEFLTGERADTPPPQTPAARPPARDDDEARRRRRARKLFAETVDPRGTLAEHYLTTERALPGIIDDTLALTLRFHPRCPFMDGDLIVRSPALIAAIRDARDTVAACSQLGDLDEVEHAILRDINRVIAVQRIRLTSDGRKIERRSLGVLQNGVVFVSSLWEIFNCATATIAEGVETALAMRALGFQGCVALAGAGRFRTFEPPGHFALITVSGENDSGASEKGWSSAGPRWAAAGHSVDVWTPPAAFKDANDILVSRAREARAA